MERRAERRLTYSMCSISGGQSGTGGVSSHSPGCSGLLPDGRAGLLNPCLGSTRPRGLRQSVEGGARRWGLRGGGEGPRPAPRTAPVGSALWFLLPAWLGGSSPPSARGSARQSASRLTEGSSEQMGGGRPASLRQHQLRGEEAGPDGGDGQQRAGAQDCPAPPVT